MSNRVEELEATVSELESTVRGLTEELVETKERLRALEEDADVDAADLVDQSTNSPPAREADPDDVRQAASQADDGTETDAPEPAETGADDDPDSGDESELGDDIIVA